MAARERQVVDRQRLPPVDARRADRAADRIGGDVERLEELLEAGLVLDDVEHLGEGHEPYAGQLLGDERVEVVAPQLAVRHDVAAEGLLQAQQIHHRLVGDAIEFRAVDPTAAIGAHRLGDPWRPRPAADGRDGKERQTHDEAGAKNRSDSTAAVSGPKPVVRPGSQALRPSRSIISRCAGLS